MKNIQLHVFNKTVHLFVTQSRSNYQMAYFFQEMVQQIVPRLNKKFLSKFAYLIRTIRNLAGLLHTTFLNVQQVE